MKNLFVGTYAPSTLGSLFRAFTFGHVRQPDAVAWRWLVYVAAVTPTTTGIDEYALIGIVSTPAAAPIILGSRLRKGAAGSPRWAGKLVGDVLATVRRLRYQATSALVLLRADSAFYGHAVVCAAHRAGAKVSITARMDPAVKLAIATIPDDAWTTIDSPTRSATRPPEHGSPRPRSPRSRSPRSAQGRSANASPGAGPFAGSLN